MIETPWTSTTRGWQATIVSSDGQRWEATVRRLEGPGFGLLLTAQVLRADHLLLMSTNMCRTINDAQIWCEAIIEQQTQ